MNKYTLNMGQQGEKVLMINGNQSTCPFVDPIPMQGKEGQLQLVRLPCNTSCPHASLTNRGTYEITCAGRTETFMIEIAENPKSDFLTIAE